MHSAFVQASRRRHAGIVRRTETAFSISYLASVQGKAAFRGHPVHLMLISFPVAFWSGALITDGIGAASGDGFWFRMSVALIAMGTIGAILASIFGYIDYLTVPMSKRARFVATCHLYASLGTIAIFAAAFALRATHERSPAGIAVTIVGALGLLFGGYFGSELSNRFGIGVVERKPKPLRRRETMR